MPWYIILFYLFVFLGSVLGLLFFFKKQGDRLANILLGTFALLFSYELLYNCFKWSGYLTDESFAHLIATQDPLWVIYGSLVYIYVRQVLRGTGFKKNDLWFLVPVIIIVVLGFPFYGMGASEKVQVIQEGTYYKNVHMPKNGIWAIMLLMFFYAWLTYHRFGPSRTPGFRENRWLKWFIGCYFGYVLAFFFYVFMVRFELMDYRYDYFVDIVIVFFIGMLSFFGFVQPEVFEGKAFKEVIPFIKYRKTGMSEALSIEMKHKLLAIMDKEKPYLENTLRLDDLAKKMNLSRNHTSQIINQHFNLSFFDFVNRYRIEEAKRLLAEAQDGKTTITQIAYDVGFNNRASFYKAFKKFEGQSPSQYLKPQHAS
ncbi:MAG: AraC family transcriptional regulator [Muricauda sp.]|uniref:Phenazine biosynthesis PhzC/PhzF protein n=1 Tax=Flagellimonas lutaonensis TaxID=516051 RepID=A0A0D5YVQ5_9FLAO|nr:MULTISPECIES: helix-turn-helix domain-containing protein [Allomuricauda]AKA35986.1 Phenazine biosynthesis PhzC/PhzF protein [Allomuricauda lutaonensis]MAU26431.1 AraC family transcriptional regulator [Allomuricauda sp.]MBC31465.1 AraC family transcriptional regulator [Allomuricauda sp.]|tara:strand:+ start:77504 stop:78610 length:1107 start_codon:yes stop_codon:yes gene_type:complete